MQKYLIINPFGIGDVLFTTPLIRAIKDRYPDSFIGYWSNERVADLLKGTAKIDKIFALSRGDIKRIYKKSPVSRLIALLILIGQIRKERFDIAFDFSFDSRYGLWSKLAGIKKRIGLDHKNRGRFLTDKIELKAYSDKHVIEHNIDLLRFIGIEPHIKSPKLSISDKDRTMARVILKENGLSTADLLIGVAPGGGESWGKDAIYKQWSAEKFGDVAVRVVKELNTKVVLLGSLAEKPIAEVVLRKMGQSPLGTVPIFPVVDLVGKLNVKELAAIISELKLLICNDGGPAHMAAALGVSTVSIFGPVDERVYGPYPQNEKHVVVKKDLSCRPCYKDFKFAGCSNNRRCLEDISAEEVFEKVKSLL
jgi:ADP-heptose:LPS heptosyltransferase